MFDIFIYAFEKNEKTYKYLKTIILFSEQVFENNEKTLEKNKKS